MLESDFFLPLDWMVLVKNDRSAAVIELMIELVIRSLRRHRSYGAEWAVRSKAQFCYVIYTEPLELFIYKDSSF